MDDYIKRADAVNAVCELALSKEEAEDFAEAIENLPGVEAVPIEDGRYIKAGEVSAIVEDGKPVGFYRPGGPMEEIEDNPSVGVADTSLCTREAFEGAKHRAEVFERMAFKLGEELDAAKKYIEKNIYVGSCGACLYKDEDSNGKHCKNCTGRNSHFIFSAEKAREEE